MSRKLAFTCGDPAGIGPEIIAAWLAAHPGLAREVAVIGPAAWLAGLPAGEKIPVGLESYAAELGQPTGEGALIAWAALERAAAGCRAGEFAGVVTGPVSKAALARLGWTYPGQTEFFGARWGAEPTMGFCGGRMRIVLATWHIPLAAVPAQLTPAVMRRAIAAAAGLARAGGVAAPRIGVCGLNPHAGEGGLLGTEERDLLDPMLDALRREFPGLSRTQAGDTLFARHRRGEFDVVVALYHDQGLAALKTVAFDTAVNITLGLPYVRTSPDHGTAFSLAGTGRASGASFRQAVALARRWVRRRPPD